jgi:uncharacterized protein
VFSEKLIKSISTQFHIKNIQKIKGKAQNSSFLLVFDENFWTCVKSKVFFNKGQQVAVLYPSIVLKYPCLHTVQVSPNFHIYDKWFAGRISHSCDPNIYFDVSRLTFYALKDIKPGDILTQDYEETEDDLYRKFTCKCGSKFCRGKIMGKLYRKHFQHFHMPYNSSTLTLQTLSVKKGELA